MQKVKQFAFERKDQLKRAAGALGLVMVLMVSMALTVFADTTYLINDGGEETYYKTDATEPEEVLAEAGVELSEHDLVTTEDGFLATTIAIRRAVEEVVRDFDCQLYMPPVSLCGDNAVMVGAQGYYEYCSGVRAGIDLNAYASDEAAEDAEASFRPAASVK